MATTRVRLTGTPRRRARVPVKDASSQFHARRRSSLAALELVERLASELLWVAVKRLSLFNGTSFMQVGCPTTARSGTPRYLSATLPASRPFSQREFPSRCLRCR